MRNTSFFSNRLSSSELILFGFCTLFTSVFAQSNSSSSSTGSLAPDDDPSIVEKIFWGGVAFLVLIALLAVCGEVYCGDNQPNCCGTGDGCCPQGNTLPSAPSNNYRVLSDKGTSISYTDLDTIDQPATDNLSLVVNSDTEDEKPASAETELSIKLIR